MSGKSTVARLLGRRHDRQVISTDDLGVAIHVALHGRAPMIAEDHREYYLTRSVDQLWQETIDRFATLADPIAAVARQHAHDWAAPAIVEGWAVLPGDVTPDLASVWLLASRELLEARARADEPFWSGARDVADMQRKFVERSLRLNDHLRQAARERPLRLVEVTVTDAPDAVADRIEAAFADRQS
jgi:hypothetical protein